MFVTEEQIAAEQRAFPGLGKLQAHNRIRQRHFFNAQTRRSFVSTNWVK